jgi:hypothetical protein
MRFKRTLALPTSSIYEYTPLRVHKAAMLALGAGTRDEHGGGLAPVAPGAKGDLFGAALKC